MLDLPKEYDEENSLNENKIIIKTNKSFFDRKYIIIKFGAKNIKNLLEMLDEQTSRVYLPQIGIVSDEPLDEECSKILYDNRFITIIEENKENILSTYSNIFSYLFDRENYYNERGNILNDYFPSKIMKIDEKINSYINILVCGISRSGKSTLINLLSRKLVSLESPESKSITTKITEYLLERDGHKIGINLIDTPGLEKFNSNGKKINYIKNVIDLIKKKMKECRDSKDDIHMIYFVFGNNTNFDGKIEFFQFLQEVNLKRLEKKRKKIPIIFIGNNIIGKEGKDALKKYLKDNNLKDLIENYGNKKEHIDFKKYGKKYSKCENSKSDIEDNIIIVNLIADKERQSHIYGIDKLLKTTLYILKKNNPFNNFSELEVMNEKIQKYLTKLNNDIPFSKEEEKDFFLYKKEIKNLMIKISEENYLLNQIKSDKDIIKRSKEKAKKSLYYFMAAGFIIGCIPIPVPFVNMALSYVLFAGMVVRIGNCYFCSFNEIPLLDYIQLIFGMETNISKSYDDRYSEVKEMILKLVQIISAVWNLGGYKIAELIGDKIGNKIGNKLGSDLAKKIGEEKVEDWGKRLLRFAPKNKGRLIFKTEINEVILQEKDKFNVFTEKLIEYIPSIKQGFKEGMKKEAESLGKDVGDIYFKNTRCYPVDKLKEMCERRSTDYTSKITEEAGKYIKDGNNLKYGVYCLKAIGFIINGAFNCYSTYKTGKNAIKYFNDYVERTLGCDYTIRQKNNYMKIFEYLEEASNENYEEFEFNFYSLSDSNYLNYALNYNTND